MEYLLLFSNLATWPLHKVQKIQFLISNMFHDIKYFAAGSPANSAKWPNKCEKKEYSLDYLAELAGLPAAKYSFWHKLNFDSG